MNNIVDSSLDIDQHYCNKILGEKNIKLKMYTQRLSLNQGIGNLNLDKKIC